MELQTTHFQAGNPHSAANKLRELLLSGDLEIRLRLAENEASPQDVLKKLSGDIDPEVRAGVANNPSATFHTIAALSLDDHDDVRFAMASNPRLSIELLQKLSQDQNPYISDRAHKTLAGLTLEVELAEQGFVSLPGASARLGELLVASEIISVKEIETVVTLARNLKIPLGRALVEAGRVDRGTIVHALKQQTLVRLGQMNIENAIDTIRAYAARRTNCDKVY